MDERIADRFERPLLVAAVLTIPVTILQLLPPADPWRTIADVLNWTIWLTFLAEVVLMLAVVPKKTAVAARTSAWESRLYWLAGGVTLWWRDRALLC